ncbi:MAG: ferric reductase-like transmembrane domain-containing protein [Burkholderiaceae bacterium]|nr:ferric reductase-like transmembrane domain-containing protein [Microbacteriaceae bacterium]
MTQLTTPGITAATRTRARNGRRRANAGDLLVVLSWTSVAVAISLYLAYGGAADFTSLSGIVSGIGIIGGLIGTDLILVMLVLAARLPFIDRTVGQDRAIAVHRSLGKPALYFLLAHGVLLTLGYGISAGLDPVAETISLFSTVADMPLAYLGLGLLIMVVVTSLVAVRRRFAYEAWHLIHLLSYAAVLVAVPHQLSAGGVLADGSWQRAYWIVLFVVAFGAIAWFRFAVPAIRTARHGLRVTGIEPVAPGVSSIHLSGRDLDRLQVAGGQYAIWRFWSRGTWWHAHPISFSAMPTGTSARITVRELGRGTGRLGRIRAGTFVSIEGPYGVFTDAARTSPYLAVIAAGIGITPARTLLEQSTLRHGEATVLLRGTDNDQRYLWNEVFALAARDGSSVYTMLGHRPRGASTWLSQEAAGRGVTIESVFPRIAESDLFICGPQPWADLVIRDALAAGISRRQIHVEKFES